MSTGTSSGGGTGGGGVGGALSLMSCVREASPPPQNYHPHQHYHHHRTSMGFPQFAGQNNVDPLPKEPKKRRFHPLRGLRRIFRRKSRGAADACSATSGVPDRDAELTRITNEDITMRHPAGHPEEVRVRSASELLIDLCDRDSVFARRGTRDDSLTKLRGESGKLSVSHDSVFPGDVPPTRPISSLDSLVTFEVLERIKTAIENRNQLTSTVLSDNTNRNINVQHSTRLTKDSSTDHPATSLPKEDLPNLETASLNHTAALHRISVRPKNRRPPRRSTPTANSGESSSMNTTTTSISEDVIDNVVVEQHSPLSHVSNNNNNNNNNNIQDLKIVVNVAGKSSPLQSTRNSVETFEESEPQLLSIRKPSSVASLSPDSLDTTSASRSSVEDQLETVKRPSIIRKPSHRGSQSSDTFEEPKPQCRRSSSNRLLPKSSPDSLDHRHAHRWFSKSTEGFENLAESDKTRPIAVKRLLLLNTPISKSTDRISKSSDSFEVMKSLGSDDSIERCRNNFEFRPRRASELISKSSDNFDILESINSTQEIKKGSSISDVNNLVRDRRSSKCNIIKSSQSAERNQISEIKNKEPIEESKVVRKMYLRRPSQRMSSESLDNLELDDRLENRRIRRPPKREFNPNQVIATVPSEDYQNDCRKPPIVIRKPSSRLQTSSESSELDSTDTFDFDRRNKSSESTETLDSLEKDSEQEIVHEGFMNNVEKSDKNDSWSSDIMATIDSDRISIADGEEDSQPFISPNKFYWRQSSDPKKNLDIHQLLEITIVTRMTDNGNNDNNQQRTTSAIEPTKEQFPVSPPTSPTVTTKHEDNHLIFDHLITNKNDEDLENMLNGNISDASIDTKSFKEKLIMFEKLGK